MEEAQSVDSIVKIIESAFAKVRLEEGTSISEGTVIDDYGTDEDRRKARMMDEKNDWRLISDRAIRKHQTSLTFMNAKGYQYNLPAYMRFVMRNYLISDSNSIDSVFHNLSDRHDKRRVVFSAPQRAAIRDFLQFFADEPKGWFRDEALRALLTWD